MTASDISPPAAHYRSFREKNQMGKIVLVVVAVLLIAAGLACASPSGLNNIPTADFTPDGVLVLQSYCFAQSGERTDLYLGAKYGAGHGIEVGLDKRVAPDPDGPMQLQAKKTWAAGETTRLCLGVANVTDDTSDHPVFPYGVVSQKLTGAARFHAGYAPQRDNHQWFVGADYTLGQGTMLRSDLVRNTTQSQTLYSVGALAPTRFGAVEGWVSRLQDSSIGGSDATIYTLKLDWAIGH